MYISMCHLMGLCFLIRGEELLKVTNSENREDWSACGGMLLNFAVCVEYFRKSASVVVNHFK